MKTRSDRLRREIAAIQARESLRTRRYPRSLRRAVVEYVHEQRSGGRSPSSHEAAEVEKVVPVAAVACQA